METPMNSLKNCRNAQVTKLNEVYCIVPVLYLYPVVKVIAV